MPSVLFLDANLIALPVVGLVGRDLIANHSRNMDLARWMSDYAFGQFDLRSHGTALTEHQCGRRCPR